jgi:hypothetical protein
VVETGGLENHCTGNRTGGSNPSPSAIQSLAFSDRHSVLTRSNLLGQLISFVRTQNGPNNTFNNCVVKQLSQ